MKWRPLKILFACECTATIRDEFRARGHDAYSCDLLPTEGDPRYHIQGDVLNELHWGWDMLIGNPPCDDLGLCGQRWCIDHWVKNKGGDWWHDGAAKREARERAVQFFRKLWNAPIDRIALEQPMSVISTRVAPKTQAIHPWQFGHPENKTTWLWLKGLPPCVQPKTCGAKCDACPSTLPTACIT